MHNCWFGIKRYSEPSCRICAVPLVSEHAVSCKECGVSGKINGLRLLLIDNMTTGATARECSGASIKAGAKEVMVITLARAGMI